MGSLVGVVLAASLSKEQLYAWGWRVPFILGVFIAPVGLYIRRQLPETIQRTKRIESGGAVLADLVRHHSRAIMLGIFIICGGTISTYVFNYMTTYAITTLHLSATIGTTLTLTGSRRRDRRLGVRGLGRSIRAQADARSSPRVVFLITIYPAYRVITSPDATPISRSSRST